MLLVLDVSTAVHTFDLKISLITTVTLNKSPHSVRDTVDYITKFQSGAAQIHFKPRFDWTRAHKPVCQTRLHSFTFYSPSGPGATNEY